MDDRTSIFEPQAQAASFEVADHLSQRPERARTPRQNMSNAGFGSVIKDVDP